MKGATLHRFLLFGGSKAVTRCMNGGTSFEARRYASGTSG
jgi:hypothetical protein